MRSRSNSCEREAKVNSFTPNAVGSEGEEKNEGKHCNITIYNI